MTASDPTQSGLTSPARGGNGIVLTILSGKGGVGKSVLALNAGVWLARQGRRVILVDADIGLANTDILLNTRSNGSLAEFNQTPLEDLLVPGPAGLKVLCGVTRAPAVHGTTQRALQNIPTKIARLRRAAEIVLVDCGAGINENVLSFALAADGAILVTTPEPTALVDAYATIKALISEGLTSNISLVVNLARSRSDADRAAHRLCSTTSRFLGRNLDNLGHIPADRHVQLAVRNRSPLSTRYPHCDASLCIEEISARIASCFALQLSPPDVWARLAGLFL